MRRIVSAGLLLTPCLALAACGQKPSANEPGDATSSVPNVAFTYSYAFRLPSARIAAAQEAHATACEQLAGRCRITGMTFNVGDDGEVAATLAVALDAVIARRFGREQVAAIEQGGGALIGADITGTDTAGDRQAAQTERAATDADLARIDHDLARPGLSPAERVQLSARRAAAVQAGRAAIASSATVRASVATTPMTFSYRAGSGVGLSARLADAGRTAWSSFAYTLTAGVTLLAVLGPPAILVLLLFLLWRRFGRHWWRRIVTAAHGG